MARVAVITLTPDGSHKADIQAGEVTNLEILDALNNISGYLARELLREYSEISGDENPDPSKLDEYMDFLRKNQL